MSHQAVEMYWTRYVSQPEHQNKKLPRKIVTNNPLLNPTLLLIYFNVFVV